MSLAEHRASNPDRGASPLLIAVAALLVALIALVGLMIVLFTRPPPDPAIDAARLHLPSRAAPSPAAAPPRHLAEQGEPAAAEASLPDRRGAAPPERRQPVEPAQSPLRPARPLAGTARVIDTGALRIGEEVVRLRGVQGESGRLAEGMAAYIGGREVSCEPAAGGFHRCSVGGWDLSAVVLFNGGGRASVDAPSDLRREESKARLAGRGVWSAR